MSSAELTGYGKVFDLGPLATQPRIAIMLPVYVEQYDPHKAIIALCHFVQENPKVMELKDFSQIALRLHEFKQYIQEWYYMRLDRFVEDKPTYEVR